MATVSETGPPDEPSRKELERLEKILTGGKGKMLKAQLTFAIVPPLFLYLLGMSGLLRGVPLYSMRILLIPYALAHGFACVSMLVFVWPRMERRAAAIRGGASYAQPADLKDTNIWLFASVGFAFAAAFIYSEFRIYEASLFLFIGALVTAFWTIGKAIIGLRRTAPDHLRRKELRGALYVAIFMLFIYAGSAVMVTRLDEVVKWYLNLSAPAAGSRPPIQLR